MNVMNCVKSRRKDYADGYNDGRRIGVNECVEFMVFAMVQYLGDKRGWKRERIMDAIQWIAKHAIMIDEEYTTFPEVKEAVKDEYGIISKDGHFIMLGGDQWHGA